MAPEVSIIIPAYQHAKEIPACLASIFSQTFRDFEVIVVNDGSTDDTLEVLKPFADRITLINQSDRKGSSQNRGNAARNRGATEAKGRFLLFCDADIIMRPEFLAKSLATLETNPQASYAYASFKFGWKVFHLWPFDPERLRRMNYIHTTALMRREHFPGFDESIRKLQDWDLWLTMLEQGRTGVWIPEVLMTAIPNKGGAAISTWVPRVFYRIPWRRLGIRMQSVERYLEAERVIKAKHRLPEDGDLGAADAQLVVGATAGGGLLAPFVAKTANHFLPMPPAPFSADARAAFRLGLLLMGIIEALSLASYLFPAFAPYAFAAAALAAAIAALIRLEYAVLALFGELMIGSQGGYLLHFDGHGLNLSLRIALFLIILGVFSAKSALDTLSKERRAASFHWLAALRKAGLFWPYAILQVSIILAIIRGIMFGNDRADVFFDANGYLYFMIFTPLIATLSVRQNRERLLGVLFAAIIDSVAKAALVLYVFSHRLFGAAKPVYLWVRDARVGEITRMVGDFYRVFFQSHLFVLMAAFGVLIAIAYRPSWKDREGKKLLAVFGVICVGLLMSFSRSFWFGGFIAAIGYAALLLWGRAKSAVWKRSAAIGFCGMLAAAVLIVFVATVPIPKKGEGFSLASLLGDRATSFDDAAANSRWALLPKLVEADLRHPFLGSGFGTSVTYRTSDPRLLADNPTGEYTTFAFEWGYHDLWLKLGLAGLAVYVWFLWAIARAFLRYIRGSRDVWREPNGEATKKPALAAGLLLGLTALIGTNVFSPYLNHPLGIGTLIAMVAFAVFEFQADQSAPDAKSR